jgi:FkbM family methyltransferase
VHFLHRTAHTANASAGTQIRFNSAMMSTTARKSLLRAFEAGAAPDLDGGPAANCAEPVTSDGSCIAELDIDEVLARPAETTLKMWVMPKDEYVSGSVLETKHVWEWGDVRTVIQDMTDAPSGYFLDIGANIGSYAVPVAGWQQSMASPDGRGVISIDANQKCTDLLRRTAVLNHMNSLVETVHAAVVQDMANYPDGVCTEMSTETNVGGTQSAVGSRDLNHCTERSPAVTLDSLMTTNAKMKNVKVMKIDCEGCEGAALYGGSQWLNAYPPCHIMFEVTEQYLCEVVTPWMELKDYLTEKGYELQTDVADFEQGGCTNLVLDQKNVWWTHSDLAACNARLST